MIKQFLFVLILGVSVSSCSKNLVPYSTKLQEEYNWSDQEIRRIQFYTSSEIILQRRITHGKSEIVSGKIKIIDGQEVEEIIIPGKTKGVAVWLSDDDRIGISFELTNEHFLTFGPNPKSENRFFLYATDWNNRVGKITYNDQVYVTSPPSAAVFLMIDMKKIDDWDIDQRKAKGRSVGK